MNVFLGMSQGKYFPGVWPIRHVTDETNLVALLNELRNLRTKGDIDDANAKSECHLSSDTL